jgi:hypothetical protein
VRLYNQGKAPGDGFWQDVTIDSLIPCALRVASRRALQRGCNGCAAARALGHCEVVREQRRRGTRSPHARALPQHRGHRGRSKRAQWSVPQVQEREVVPGKAALRGRQRQRDVIPARRDCPAHSQWPPLTRRRRRRAFRHAAMSCTPFPSGLHALAPARPGSPRTERGRRGEGGSAVACQVHDAPGEGLREVRPRPPAITECCCTASAPPSAAWALTPQPFPRRPFPLRPFPLRPFPLRPFPLRSGGDPQVHGLVPRARRRVHVVCVDDDDGLRGAAHLEKEGDRPSRNALASLLRRPCAPLQAVPSRAVPSRAAHVVWQHTITPARHYAQHATHGSAMAGRSLRCVALRCSVACCMLQRWRTLQRASMGTVGCSRTCRGDRNKWT